MALDTMACGEAWPSQRQGPFQGSLTVLADCSYFSLTVSNIPSVEGYSVAISEDQVQIHATK